MFSCFNETIIFNPKNNEINIINNKEYNKEKDYPNLLKNKINSTIFTNYEDDLQRHSKLKRCSKCILLETYPFITFDKNGVCNFCQEYDQQKFLSARATAAIVTSIRKAENDPATINEKIESVV